MKLSKEEIKKILDYEEALEKEASLITEAVGDVIAISCMNDEATAMDLINSQFLVISRQDLSDEE